jgi:hypothetical protein
MVDSVCVASRLAKPFILRHQLLWLYFSMHSTFVDGTSHVLLLPRLAGNLREETEQT